MFKKLRDERGAQLVEFAIILPLLLMLVFGIIDFGRGFFSYMIITNGAREGARVASVGKDEDAIIDRVQNAITGLAVSGIDVGACVSPANGRLCITGANLEGLPDTPVSVTVRYNFSYIVLPNVLAMAGGSTLPGGVFPLTATSTMRLE